MSMPFYVSPEQLMKDRADFARKGIARGRSVVVVQYADGVLFVSENPSAALHKISEIYDRIAFAAVGRYNEFENLRIAGVRLADMRGYSYDRRDVTGAGWPTPTPRRSARSSPAVARSPTRWRSSSPRSGDTAEDDQIYRLTYDGQVADEHGYAVMGGAAEAVTTYLKERYRRGLRATRTPCGSRSRRWATERDTATATCPPTRPRGGGARPDPHASRASSGGSGPASSPSSSATALRRRRRTARPTTPGGTARSRPRRARRPADPTDQSAAARRRSRTRSPATARHAPTASPPTDRPRVSPARRGHRGP